MMYRIEKTSNKLMITTLNMSESSGLQSNNEQIPFPEDIELIGINVETS